MLSRFFVKHPESIDERFFPSEDRLNLRFSNENCKATARFKPASRKPP